MGSHTTHPQQVVYAVGCYLLWVFAVVPSLLIIRFLYWVIPLWLPSALSVGLVWAAVEVYSKIEKKYFTKARERAYYRLYPERKDKNYFWLQLLLPLWPVFDSFRHKSLAFS